MGKKPDKSNFLKGQVAALNNEGYSQSEIARRLKISRCAVQNVLKSSGATRRSKCRGVRKTTPREDRFLKSVVQSSPHTSSANVSHLANERGIEISSRTVRRRLSSGFNLVARRPARKPMLTRKQLCNRLNFCKAMKSKSAD